MTESSQDDDEKMEYLKAGLLQHQPLSGRPPSNRPFRAKGFGLDDDDSSNLFMSEPSVSEADESSEHHMRFLSPLGSFTEDEDSNLEEERDYIPPPPPPPPRMFTPVAPSSPGNTSLSSWESPHLNRHRIHLHFSPGGDSQSHKADSSVQSNPQHQFQQRASPYSAYHPPPSMPAADPYLATALIPPSSGGAKTPDRSYVHHSSSNSTSPVSEGRQRVLQTFLDDLRVNSQGQFQEAIGANTSFGSSTVAGVPNTATTSTLDLHRILRTQTKLAPRIQSQQYSRLQNIGTAAVVDYISASVDESVNGGGSIQKKLSKGNAADETIVMILSDDSGDDSKIFEESAGHALFDWGDNSSNNNVSADDEKIAERRAPPRTVRSARSFGAGGGRGGSNYNNNSNNNNNGTGKGHRRQRSGDAAAATLSTGSSEWKGMERNKIPLPPVPGGHDDEDEDEEDGKHPKPMNGSNRNNKPRQIEEKNEKNKSGTSLPGPTPLPIKLEINQFSNFSLGTGGNEKACALRRVTTNSNRNRRHSYRGRKTAGIILDSEDSSSSMASRDPPLLGRRTASLPASAFSGYLASPDWSMPESRQHTKKGIPPVHWSPQSYHSGTISSMGMDSYNLALTGPTQLGNQTRPPPPPPSNASMLRSYSMDFNPRSPNLPAEVHDTSAWAHHSTGSMDTDFSWLSGERHTFFPRSEMSPLVGSGFRSYDGLPNQSKHYSSVHPCGFEQGRRAKSRSAVNFGPFLEGGKKAFEASPFSTIGKKFTKADRRRFLPSSSLDNNDENYRYFVCPVCKARQREFFTVTNAPRQFENTSGYIAFYFGIYVIAALYIFGLQEGWGKLDCIYFAVITLTTAGLGDFVPTTDGAKVVCSIFIYFGVACIGLLLGSYIAGMLDESSRRAARANRIKSCPNCARVENIRDAAEKRQKQLHRQRKLERRNQNSYAATGAVDTPGHDAKRVKRQHAQASFKDQIHHLVQSERSGGRTNDQIRRKNSMELASSPQEDEDEPRPTLLVDLFTEGSPSNYSLPSLNSPSTARILRRQSHSRHASIDLDGGVGVFNVHSRRRYSADFGVPATIEETPTSQFGTANPPPPPPRRSVDENGIGDDDDNEFDDSSTSSSSTSGSSSSEASLKFEEQYDTVKNARYVFLTFREALINSLIIIGTGCLGFYFIEGFSFIDSWYFTTVLLTTVGYGDLVPYTKGGKLFATIYILVAGTILLNNMSMISMIPLELRRRRLEKVVLTQFGDSLDDNALRELATGPLIRKLNLATHNALDECTREMFCLAMLVRLGKVTEEDIRLTFAAFKKLDVNDENVLNSRAIIGGMIQRHRSRLDLAGLAGDTTQAPLNHSSPSPSSYGFSPWGSKVTSNIFVPSTSSMNERTHLVGTYNSAIPENTSESSAHHSDQNFRHYSGPFPQS